MRETAEILNMVNGVKAPDFSYDEVNEIMARYPYFYIPALLYISQPCATREQKEALVAKVAVKISDRKALYALVEDNSLYENFYPQAVEEEVKPDTDTAIDRFLDNYGNSTDNAREVELLDKLIFNPVPDYSAVLEQEEKQERKTAHKTADTPKSEADALIDSFIEQHAETKVEVTVPESEEIPTEETKPAEEAPLTESLAQIYIKQKRYSKALDIIRKLSLKYPEKNIYFADQIRFLEKLIINTKTK